MMIKTLTLTTLLMSINAHAFQQHEAEKEFGKAWENPAYTQIRLPDLDINAILSTYYVTEPEVRFTRSMLWDLEWKKAWNPQKYIPEVAKDGHSWNRKIELEQETFVRSTKQRQWLDFSQFGDVFEKVHLNHQTQRATFIGVRQVEDENLRTKVAINPQTLFHIEHGVRGSEDQPLNTWRAVHLTSSKDQNLIQAFRKFEDLTVLPSYILHYIEIDLKAKVRRK